MLRRIFPIIVLFILSLLALPCRAQERIKFPVGVSNKTQAQSPLYVAQRKGFYEQQGLEVQLILLRGGAQTIQALVGGSLYVAAASAALSVGAIEGGADLAMVGGVVNGPTHAIVGGKKYKTYQDLRGAIVGVNNLTGGPTLLLRRLLESKGLRYPRDYQLLGIGAGAGDNLALLSSGKVTATSLTVPLNYIAEAMGFNTIGYITEAFPQLQQTVFVLHRPWAQKHRGLVVQFLKAMVQAGRWLNDNEDASVALMAKELDMKPEHIRRGWEYHVQHRIWSPEADINMEGLKTALELYFEANPVKGVINPQKYVDRSYLKEALQR